MSDSLRRTGDVALGLFAVVVLSGALLAVTRDPSSTAPPVASHPVALAGALPSATPGVTPGALTDATPGPGRSAGVPRSGLLPSLPAVESETVTIISVLDVWVLLSFATLLLAVPFCRNARAEDVRLGYATAGPRARPRVSLPGPRAAADEVPALTDLRG